MRSMAAQALGFVIVALLPTAFWTVALHYGAAALGFQLSNLLTCILAGLMFLLLVCIWASFAMASDNDRSQ
jgi:hypothetical protein